jgi:hypothetical protein
MYCEKTYNKMTSRMLWIAKRCKYKCFYWIINMLFVNTCLELFLKQERVQHDTTAASLQGKVIQVYIKSKCGCSMILLQHLYKVKLYKYILKVNVGAA